MRTSWIIVDLLKVFIKVPSKWELAYGWSESVKIAKINKPIFHFIF